MVLQRLAFLIHWAAFIAFVVIWAATIHWLATNQYADLEQVLGKILLQVGHLFEWLMIWGLPVFCIFDWVLIGKITIFPWRRQ